jgi:hypothetical protein
VYSLSLLIIQLLLPTLSAAPNCYLTTGYCITYLLSPNLIIVHEVVIVDPSRHVTRNRFERQQ